MEKSFGSNHKTVHLSYNVDDNTPANSTQQLPPRRRLWKLNKIKDPEIRRKYKEETEDFYQSINIKTSQSEITSFLHSFTSQMYELLYHTMDQTLGSTIDEFKQKSDFWTTKAQVIRGINKRDRETWKRFYHLKTVSDGHLIPLSLQHSTSSLEPQLLAMNSQQEIQPTCPSSSSHTNTTTIIATAKAPELPITIETVAH
ncbi:hypothetical protein BDA99DRAFT_559596 [Phascolomyces articulosus]|uniref:Uncharacterized protein n=1 Tax=Phascolomyces articulosus TaxID=60185 RepID=A0AAD5K190_9FUNG|nr:hypothetical protein BDA99DRAFT_559596 [Phascolomyces articulosus]